MKTPQRLLWTEGMFLSPQHFQGLDRFLEGALASRLEAVSPWLWGVAALDVDSAALGAGQLRIQRFEGIFPDGLAVAFTERDAEAPPARAVAAHFPASARSVDVLLGVARERDGVSAYGEGAGEASARFAVSHRPVQDAGRPGAAVTVSFARPRTCILFGDESAEDHEVIKIGELTRTPAGQVVLAESYLPPLMQLGGAPRLLGGLRGLVAQLVAKHRDLAGGRHVREGAAEVSAPDLSRMLQVLTLGGAIPEVVHLSNTPAAPPLAAYLALSRLAGQLAAFMPDSDVTGLPRYAHDDLRATFDPLLARLGAFLGGLAVEQYTRVPLEVRGGLQIARLQDERLLRSQFYLLVRSEIPEAQVGEQLPRLCKAAALVDVQSLVQAAAPGLPLQFMLRPPPEIPARPGEVCFAVAQADRLWKTVISDRTLALSLPPPFDPGRTKIELVAVGAPTRAGG
jgi:type VI secretion system protein ImpJ